MARDIFVDTSGFYALLVKRDDRHEQASRILTASSKKSPSVCDDGLCPR